MPTVVSDGEPAPPPTPKLGDLLADPALRADKKAAFTTLYARWRLDFDGDKTALACERGRAEGLECLFKTGRWAKLRRYNLPAIIDGNIDDIIEALRAHDQAEALKAQAGL